MNVVFDTNIYISGLLSKKGVPGQLIKAWQQNVFTLCTSRPIISEIERVLHYKKIQKMLRWDAKTIEEYMILLDYHTHVVDISEVHAVVPNDPKDDMVLATYIAASADYLVSGDSDLLSLQKNYSIITPTDFANILF